MTYTLYYSAESLTNPPMYFLLVYLISWLLAASSKCYGLGIINNWAGLSRRNCKTNKKTHIDTDIHYEIYQSFHQKSSRYTLEINVLIDNPKHRGGLWLVQKLKQKLIGVLERQLTKNKVVELYIHTHTHTQTLKQPECYLTYLYVDFALPKRMSKFHLLNKTRTMRNHLWCWCNNETEVQWWLFRKQTPLNEREKELLPTSVDLVGASFHGLHGSYWKMSELVISTMVMWV